MFDVILPAGGSGSRFGAEKNKLLVPLKGKPVLQYALELIADYPGRERLLIPCRPQDREEIEAICGALPRRDPGILLLEGGKNRQESVYKALKESRGELVLIHDGARPFASKTMVEACLKALKKYPAVTAGVLSKDTIKIVNEKKEVVLTTDRSRSYLIQTPQGFWRKELLEAHERFRTSAVTDDCALMELAGYPVKVIEGAYSNIKITTPEDLFRDPV